MKTMNWDESTSCKEIVRAAQSEDVILMKDGHATALVTPFDDEDLEWYAREHDPEFLASITRARQQVERGQTRTHLELRRELGLD